MNRAISFAAFFLGLFVVGWVGLGYLGASPLALLMTVLIGVVFVVGAVELWRFNAATDRLTGALAAIPDPLPALGDWLAGLPAPLQTPVRLRIDGERVGLPGPALTPYLVGLLVLLGMLGTFLGMVVTLNGAVIALESSTDLATIRGALSAPVKGLGVAFGTSVAGVAASAMLGLISAFSRRDRLGAAQQLDAAIVSRLRPYSFAHQREETFRALQQQAQVLPDVAERLQAMMAHLEHHGEALGQSLLDAQQTHYQDARGLFADLAASVDASLTRSLTETSRLAGETLRPAVEAAMAGIANETAQLHARVAGTVDAQLDGIARRFDTSVGTVTDGWTAALARHEATSTAAADGLRDALAGFNASFDERATALLAEVEQRQTTAQADLSATLAAVTADSRALNGQLAERVGQQLDGLGERFSGAVGTVTDGWTAALARHEATSTAAADGLRDALAGFNASFEARAGALVAEHARTSAGLAADTRAALQSFADTFATRSAALVATVHDAHTALQRDATGRDAAQLEATHAAIDALLTRLRDEWQAVGARAVAQQDALCTRLESTARRVAEAAEAQASRTIDEVAGLMAQVADAPKAAAEVVGALRSELSASIARDTAQLAERSRIMDTLATLLEAINHASTEQRSAIDALVSSASGLLERLGARFEERMGAEAGRMADIADRIGSGAIEVASLGEAFGGAVQMFADASNGLLGSLQRIESALEKSTTRSDEQLAYYVAQAREVIDLSILSQKQIVEDLQRLAARPAGEG